MDTVNIENTEMAKKIRGRGRPATGRKGRPMQLYAEDSFIALIDEWRAEQRPIPARSVAIRYLIETHPAIRGRKKK
jgi:hypothetical protein